MVVKTHQGSLNSGSSNLDVLNNLLPSWLLYSKLAQVSRTQYGWTMSRVMMKALAPHFGRKGRILSHAIRLWTKYEMYKRAAVLLSILLSISYFYGVIVSMYHTIHTRASQIRKRSHDLMQVATIV